MKPAAIFLACLLISGSANAQTPHGKSNAHVFSSYNYAGRLDGYSYRPGYVHDWSGRNFDYYGGSRFYYQNGYTPVQFPNMYGYRGYYMNDPYFYFRRTR